MVDGFFSNLLPEGEVRQQIARRLGVSVGNDFGLLTAIGGDCAGAVSLLEPGTDPTEQVPEEVHWMTERQLAEAVARLPDRPLFLDPDGGIRLSLAGAQHKLPVIVRDGRVGIPMGRTPSTHILKAPIGRLEDTVLNEAFCLDLARDLGLDAAKAEILDADSQRVLVVERYDRTHDGGEVHRVHQEDFCQALGVAPERKYQGEGGPGFADSFGLLRSVAATPARDVLALADAATQNFLTGNHDAHGKNFSLLYAPEGTRLAPLYDLVSTVVYPGLSRKMAMKLGGEYRPPYVRRRHIDRFADGAGLGPAAVRRRMVRLARAAPDVASDVLHRYREDGRAKPILERVVDTIDQRATHLERELGSSPNTDVEALG